MKLIIELEATFKNNSDMEVKVRQKSITSICKGCAMKQDMLNSQIHLTSQGSVHV